MSEDEIDVDAAIRALGEPKPHLRRKAAKLLGRSGAEAAVLPLLGVLFDPDGDASWEANKALVAIGPPAVAALVERLRPTEPRDVLIRVLDILGRIRDVSALASIVALFGHPDSLVRENAVAALVGWKAPQALEAARTALSHPDDSMRGAAAYALRESGEPIDDSSDSSEGVRRATLDTWLERHDVSSVPRVIEMLQDPRSGVRQSAREAFKGLAPPEALRQVAELLRHADPGVRETAADLLKDCTDPQYDGVLLDATSDESHWVRVHAITGLGSCRSTRAVPTLRHVIDDPAHLVSWSALKALGDIGDAASVDVLMAALDHPDESVRVQATIELGRIGDERAAPRLIAAACRGDVGGASAAYAWIIAAGAVKALPALARALSGRPSDDYRIKTMLSCYYQSGHPRVRAMAKEWIALHPAVFRRRPGLLKEPSAVRWGSKSAKSRSAKASGKAPRKSPRTRRP